MKRLVFVILMLVLFFSILTIFFQMRKNIYEEGEKISSSQKRSGYITSSPSGNLKSFYKLKPNLNYNVDHSILTQLGYPPNSDITYKINSDGLNQLTKYEIEKPKNTFRIVTIGDSFTFGDNVNTKDNYPSQLELLLRNDCSKSNFEVINLGVSGYDFQYAVESYRLTHGKYTPDLILWFVIEDDFQRINEIMQPYIQEHVNKALSGNKKLDANAQAEIYRKEWHAAHDLMIKKAGGDQKLLTLESQYLKSLNNFYNGNLLLFTFSDMPHQYTNALQEFSRSRKGIYLNSQIPNIYANKSYFLKDRHPSKSGYSVITHSLFEYLKKSKLISC